MWTAISTVEILLEFRIEIGHQDVTKVASTRYSRAVSHSTRLSISPGVGTCATFHNDKLIIRQFCPHASSSHRWEVPILLSRYLYVNSLGKDNRCLDTQ